MPYFPPERVNPYQCPGCHEWYLHGNVACSIHHSPGTCCHYGETKIVTCKVGQFTDLDKKLLAHLGLGYCI